MSISKRKKIDFLCYKFFTSRQGGLSLKQFVSELRNESCLCKFKNLIDDMILRVLISGTNNSGTREQLLQKEDFKPVKLSAIIEQAKVQSKRVDIDNNQQVMHISHCCHSTSLVEFTRGGAPPEV